MKGNGWDKLKKDKEYIKLSQFFFTRSVGNSSVKILMASQQCESMRQGHKCLELITILQSK